MIVDYIDVIKQRYQNLGYQPYRWFKADSETHKCNLKLPVKESKLGLLSTSGAYAIGQKAFHYKDDTSIRKIKKETATQRFLLGSSQQDQVSLLLGSVQMNHQPFDRILH